MASGRRQGERRLEVSRVAAPLHPKGGYHLHYDTLTCDSPRTNLTSGLHCQGPVSALTIAFMTQPGRVDYDQVARAQALLLTRHRLSPTALVAAYRTVRTAKPDAYTDLFVKALIAYNHGPTPAARVPACAEAVEVARTAAEHDPRYLELQVTALNAYQQGLCDAGRRAEALEACREMAATGRRAHAAGVVESPTFGSRALGFHLAEIGQHAEAAELLGAIVQDTTRETWSGDFWMRIAWIAELEAAGSAETARDALQTLVDEDRLEAEQETGPYAMVIWEQLLLASMDREHGRSHEAEQCEADTESLLVRLAAEGEPKNWSNILAFWAALASLTGRKQDQPEPGEPEPLMFAGLSDGTPVLKRAYRLEGRDRLRSEVLRLKELAEHDRQTHLAHLVEVYRMYTLRSVSYREMRTWQISDELRTLFDNGIRLARMLVDVDERLGRAKLRRALADRTGMHVAARDFPPALRDFSNARLVAAGARIA